MKQFMGYFGMVLIAVAVAAFVVQMVIKAIRKGKEDIPAEKRQKKERKPKKERTVKKTPAAFAVPGSSEAPSPVAPRPSAPQGRGVPTPVGPFVGEAQDIAGTVLMEVSEGGFGPAQCLLDVATLRYTGKESEFPGRVSVVLRGETFSIGRVDVALGRAQSDFEFPADTKAVSRRHAAISRDQGGYIIQDLGSKAGTFVNGAQLQPQVLYRLENGDVISFGNGGADYIWEA